MLARPMFAQDLVETGFLDSFVTFIATAAADVERSIKDHPWIWVAAAVLCLVLLVRPKR